MKVDFQVLTDFVNMGKSTFLFSQSVDWAERLCKLNFTLKTNSGIDKICQYLKSSLSTSRFISLNCANGDIRRTFSPLDSRLVTSD
jgi:hypothetical protein